MFFGFAFYGLLAVIVTNKMSNSFEDLYDGYKKSDSDNECTENTDLGDILILSCSTV